MSKITLVTLGVANLAASKLFYETLGWTIVRERLNMIFFHFDGIDLCLYPKEELAAELGCTMEELGAGNTLLTMNWTETEQVAHAYNHALACGATALRLPAQMPWGGYAGYWADPDGNVWEYAMDPDLLVKTNDPVTA